MESSGSITRGRFARGSGLLSPTQVSQLHQITSSTQVTGDPSHWRMQQRTAILYLSDTVMGRRFGAWYIPKYTLEFAMALRGLKYAPALCTTCSRWCSVLVSSLRSGKSMGCRECAVRPTKYTDIPALQGKQLQERYNALTERIKANKPTSRTYAGVENHFTSCEDFVRHMWENYPRATYKGWEVDRIDTNGHYSKENIRLTTRSVNAQTRKVNRVWFVAGTLLSSSALCREFFPEWHKTTVMIHHKEATGIPEMVARYTKRFGTSSTQDRAIALHATGLLYQTVV